MRSKSIGGLASLLALLLHVPASPAQDSNIYWHIDPTVKTCSMVIDPSLTQGQWHTFVSQAGAIMSFKSLATASTLGRLGFTVAIDDGYTPVDQHDLAWINTFTHPDESCPLGDAVQIATIRGRVGVSSRFDIGGYWTSAPNANYGGVGGEVKYALALESEKSPAVAARASASILTGVPDFNMSIYSAEVSASKRFGVVAPYLGFRQNVAVGKETTSKVDLATETLGIPQGYVGAVGSIWMLQLAAEYDVATVNTLALSIGFTR
jgi:hypothetical protein